MALRIAEEAVCSAVGPDEAFNTTRAAHLALCRGAAVNVPRARARAAGFTLHSMSAVSSELGYAAAKVYASTAHGYDSWVLLFSSGSGELLAMIAANELGRLRTAAASVVAADVLAAPGAETLAIIGCGFQAEGVARAYLRRGLCKEVVVYCRNEARRSAFAEQIAASYQAPARAASSADEACEQAQIVATVTTSPEPVIEARALKHVGHISALGSNALSRRELAPRVITGASALVVDELETAHIESGNLLGPIESGRVQWAALATLGEVLDHRRRIQLPTAGYTVFLSHGLAVQDLYLAAEIYKRVSGATPSG